ncbi:MAG: hypothetical protein ACOC6G_00565 [Thermoproteota archaeon]
MNIKKNRRGQGTIIGATFVILIIISGYTLFTVYNNSMTSLQHVRADMLEREFEKGKETLELDYLPINNTHEDLYIKNIGPLTSHIVYINDITEYNFNPIEGEYLHPGEEVRVTDLLSRKNITIPRDNKIQVLTERGNIYETKYESEGEIPPTRQQLNDILEAMRQVMGNFLIDYDSFGWTEVDDLPNWNKNWLVDRKVKSDYVFRLNITYWGDQASFEVGSGTLMHFIPLDGAADTRHVSIVSTTGGYDNETIDDSYNTVIFDELGETKTLYFSGSPNFNRDGYAITLGLMGEDYAQSIPFGSITVIDEDHT